MANIDRKISTDMVHLHDVRIDADYSQWLVELKLRYRSAQLKAAVKVNAEKLWFNWQLGCDLVLKKAEERWGAGVVEQISLDLQSEFPGDKGFSATNLRYMKQWYLFYSSEEARRKLQQYEGTANFPRLVGESSKFPQPVGDFPGMFAYVPWGHHREIISHTKDIDEAIFYLHYTIQHAVSRDVLVRIMKKEDLYHHQTPAVNNFEAQLPTLQNQLAQQIIRENYDFSFATVEHPVYDESELEDALHKCITDLLLELGTGFAFMGRQREFQYGDKSRRVDLLFYHIRLRSYVVVELKARAFEPEFAGKLNFYVNLIDDTLRQPDDNPTIGLLICSDMDKAEVQWSFRGIDTPMGVATYNNVRIQEALPSQVLLKERIQKLQRELAHTKKLLGKSK